MVFSRKLTRAKLLEFFAGQPARVVALEACGGAHHWAGQLQEIGHEVRLIPPSYVKPFVKRNKNDAIDAEAICEAAQRPSMRYVAVKTEEQQASALVFRARDLLVRQRTQIINALRGHMAEYGWVAPQGPAHMDSLVEIIVDPASLPDAARPVLLLMLETLRALTEQIATLDKEISRRAREDEMAVRLMTIPGIGPITALAFKATIDDPARFARSRSVGAYVGLTSRRHASGEVDWTGRISKCGDAMLRKLPV
jgi:transposase